MARHEQAHVLLLEQPVECLEARRYTTGGVQPGISMSERRSPATSVPCCGSHSARWLPLCPGVSYVTTSNGPSRTSTVPRAFRSGVNARNGCGGVLAGTRIQRSASSAIRSWSRSSSRRTPRARTWWRRETTAAQHVVQCGCVNARDTRSNRGAASATAAASRPARSAARRGRSPGRDRPRHSSTSSCRSSGSFARARRARAWTMRFMRAPGRRPRSAHAEPGRSGHELTAPSARAACPPRSGPGASPPAP